MSFVSAFLCEPNSVIKFSQTGIWKWRRKIPLLLSYPINNYSNLNFNKHEKAGNEIVLNWRFLLVNGKAKREQKNSFQNITAFFSVACLAKVSGHLYQYIMLNLIQILIDFLKFQTQIFQWELFCKFYHNFRVRRLIF